MGEEKNSKLFKRFLSLSFKLDGLEFFGLARLLKVSFNSQGGEAKEFEEVFQEIQEAFKKLENREQKRIIKIIEKELRDKEINRKRFKNLGKEI